MVQSPWRTVRSFLKNVQHRVTLLPRNCTPRYILRRNLAALFIMARNGNNSHFYLPTNG